MTTISTASDDLTESVRSHYARTALSVLEVERRDHSLL
jgi:hypothetical protein